MTRSAAIQLLNDDTASLMRERGQEQANISGKRVDSSKNKNDAEKMLMRRHIQLVAMEVILD